MSFCSKEKNFGVKKDLTSRGTYTRHKKPILDFALYNEVAQCVKWGRLV